MNKRKGFTLIELIIAISIGLMVMVIAYNILFIGIRGHSSTFRSFENQADIRYAIETTNNAIRFSTVGFMVTEDDFKPVVENGEIKELVKPWNYIGLGPDKKSIVHYKYVSIDGKTGYYKMDVLTHGLEDLIYDLKFTKPSETQEDKIIRYMLKVSNNRKSDTIATEVEAINALHIIDWGDAKKPAIALAYRTEETPEIHKKPVAAISMVLDTSGSMNWGMNGEGTTTTGINGNNPVRLSLLKNTLNDPNGGLFSIFKESDVYVSLVPFSYNANMPHSNYNSKDVNRIDLSSFYNVKISDEKNKLQTMVNALTADGATNTGDGMRRAYYQLKKFNENKSSYELNSKQQVKNYMVVLVDGVTTAGSANINIRRNGYGYFDNFLTSMEDLGIFYTNNRNLSGYGWLAGKHPSGYTYYLTNQKHSVGNGVSLDITYGEPYVQKIGEMIQGSKIIDQAFIIGYSNAKDRYGKFYELESVTNIARSFGITVGDNEANEKFINNDFVFVATDRESLREAFENIGGYINEELWQIDGPKLKP